MTYRIITALVLAAVLIACYHMFEDGGGSTASDPRPSQQQTAPTNGSNDALKGFKIP